MTTETTATPRLIWTDVETTGLVPAAGEILELGIVITDLDLTEVDRRSWVLPHKRDKILTLMDDYVLRMHLNSGLLGEVWERAAAYGDADLSLAREDIFHNAADFIWTGTPESTSKTRFLAGSSVHFDRDWLQLHASKLTDLVSYRMVDVSVFKVAFPGTMVQRDQDPAHRALADLDYSMDQLRQMRELLGLPTAYPGGRVVEVTS